MFCAKIMSIKNKPSIVVFKQKTEIRIWISTKNKLTRKLLNLF